MLQNVGMGGCEHAPACAEQVASTSLPTPLGMRYSRAHVAATILSSLITFGLAPSVAAAQSHLPQCPSDRNQAWTDCTGVYSYPDGSRYVGEFRDNKRSGQGTLTFGNGDKYVGEWSDGNEKMDRALTHLLVVTNTLAIGEMVKETDGARKRTLMEAATLANGGTAKKWARHPNVL